VTDTIYVENRENTGKYPYECRTGKTEMQSWLKTIPFSHFITIEPTPSLPYKMEEVINRLRTIEFKLNKKYLLNSFTKWKDDDRFWMMGFAEGNGIEHQRHYHVLLHSPSVLYKKSRFRDLIRQDIQMGWIIMPSINPYNGRRREVRLNRKLPINVQTVENNDATVIYCSKWMDSDVAGGELFFTTPSIHKPTKVAA
jgi:hypothetical protein